jgi:site-specific DNA recombinase
MMPRCSRSTTLRFSRTSDGYHIRVLIERITLTPGAKRGRIAATLHGDLGTILEWTAQMQKKTPGASASGVSVSVVAGARNTRFLRLVENSIPKLAA